MKKKFVMYLVVAAIVSVIASAALVNYLSNPGTVTVTVDSPLLLQVSGDNDTWTESIAIDTYGLETIEFYTILENRVSVDIEGDFDVIIENDLNNITCEEFTLVTFDGNVVGCEQLSESVRFSEVINIDGNETHYRSVAITFGLVEPTTYTISTQVMAVEE